MAIIDGSLLVDILYGTSEADTIYGYEDDDEIYGYEGNDVIYGGDGSDVINGGQGDDLIFGNNDDWINGETGDIINGGGGNDHIIGGQGGEFISGDDPTDILNGGGPGNDILNGGNFRYNSFAVDILSDYDGGADIFVLGNRFAAQYRGSGYAFIQGFSAAEGDKIKVFGSIDDYQVIAVDDFYYDYEIFYQGDLLAQVKSVIAIDPSSDFIFC